MPGRPRSRFAPQQVLAMARGSRSPEVPARWLLCPRQVPSAEHPGNKEVALARSSPKTTSFLLDVSEFFAELRRSLAHFEPIEESIRRLQPDAEPLADFSLFFAFGSFHFAVVRNHLRAAFTQSRNFQYTLHGRSLSVGLEAAQQFIQPRQADFGILQSLEVQDIFEFFLEALLGFFPLGELHLPA